MTFLVQWIADALSLYILDILFEGITFSQNKDIIITALLLMLVNAIIKPILKLLSTYKASKLSVFPDGCLNGIFDRRWHSIFR